MSTFSLSWATLRPHLEALLDLSVEERRGYLDRRLGAQPQLREELEALLDAEAPDLLEDGAAARLPALLADFAGATSPDELGDERIQDWNVRGVLGRGGMATVYRVDRTRDGFTLEAALKLLHLGLDAPALRARFRRERAVLARLRHPGIAHLIDGGVAADGRPYLVMELVEGRTLPRYCSAEGLDIDGRLSLFRGVCEAVAYAHRRLVVHRDLKPSNVLVTAGGQVKLLDFGVAKVLEESQDSPPTVVHAPMTPAYASPEQRRGEAVTTASDVYSLGILLWELLVGARPDPSPRGPSSGPGEPSSAVADPALERRLRGDLDAIVQHCLEPDPEDRYQGPGELIVDLDRYLCGAPVSIRAVSGPERLRRWIARNRLAATAILVAAISLVSGTIVSSLSSHRARLERGRAVEQAAKARGAMAVMEGLLGVSATELRSGKTLTARELLARAEDRLAGDLMKQPELQREVWILLHRLYSSLSLFSEAVAAAERAVAMERAQGASRVEIARAEQRLGFALIRAGRPLLAVELMESSVKILEAEFGPLAPEVVNALRELSYADVKRSPAELETLRRSVLDRERRLSQGRDTASLAQSLSDHSRTLLFLGALEEAQSEAGEALAMRRRMGSPAVAIRASLNNLSLIQHARKDFVGAERSAREALDSAQREHGPRDISTVTPSIRLSSASLAQGRSHEAFQAAKNALEIQNLVAPHHRRKGDALRVLAEVECVRADFRSAETHLRDAEAMIAASYPNGSWRLAEVRATLGRCLAQQGRSAEARELLESSRDDLAAELGEKNPFLPDIDALLSGPGAPATTRTPAAEATGARDRTVR